jgi:LysM repeat protein
MTKVDCPVCGKTDLADHLAQCPQCNADLECFWLLDSLYETQVTPSVNEESLESLSRHVAAIGPFLHRLQDRMHQGHRAAEQRMAILTLMVAILGLVIMVGAWLLYSRWDTPQKSTEVMPSSVLLAELANERPQERALREAVAQAMAGIAQVSGQITALEQRMAELATPPPVANPIDPVAAEPEREPAFLSHELRKNESLWRIAQTYYQQGALYPALLETNPGLGIYFDPDDGPLRLPPDRQAAEAIVARMVFTQDGKRWFRYPVQVGDTWESIAERFYGRTDDAAWLQALNADAQPQPGTRVQVPLRE